MPFDIGFGELILIGIVALIVVGPKDLPNMFRAVGRFTGRMRAMADEFRRTMEAAADESGVNDIRRDFKEAERDMRNFKLADIDASAAELEAGLKTEMMDAKDVLKPSGKTTGNSSKPVNENAEALRAKTAEIKSKAQEDMKARAAAEKDAAAKPTASPAKSPKKPAAKKTDSGAPKAPARKAATAQAKPAASKESAAKAAPKMTSKPSAPKAKAASKATPSKRKAAPKPRTAKPKDES